MYMEFSAAGSKFHQFHPKILQNQTNSASQKCRHHVNFNGSINENHQFQPSNAHFNTPHQCPSVRPFVQRTQTQWSLHISTPINEIR